MTPQTTPGPLTVSKVVNNYRPQGSFAYLEWEEFVSEQDEVKARREGGRAVDSDSAFRIFKSSEGFMLGIEDQMNIVRDPVVDLDPAQQFLIVCDLWALRANTHQIAALCTADEYVALTFHYEVAFKKNPMMAFRAATMNEIRCCDRSVHLEFLPWVGNGSAVLSQCLEWYATNRDSHSLFQIIDSVPKELPDRGIEQSSVAKYAEGSATPGQSKKRSPDGYTSAGDDSSCVKCGKARSQHSGNRFCKLSPAERQKYGKGGAAPSTQQQKGKGAGPNASGASGAGDGRGNPGAGGGGGARGKGQPRVGKQGKLPPHMDGCAASTPCSQEFPSGESFCWDFNNKNKGCPIGRENSRYGAKCNRVHLCPKFLTTGARKGQICMDWHAAFNCR
jgi:hypothetical protein